MTPKAGKAIVVIGVLGLTVTLICLGTRKAKAAPEQPEIPVIPAGYVRFNLLNTPPEAVKWGWEAIYATYTPGTKNVIGNISRKGFLVSDYAEHYWPTILETIHYPSSELGESTLEMWFWLLDVNGQHLGNPVNPSYWWEWGSMNCTIRAGKIYQLDWDTGRLDGQQLMQF